MKFGAPLDDVVPMGLYAMKSQHLRLESVGMHIGSQIFDAGDYCEGASKLVALVTRLRAQGVDTVLGIDVGGGLGIRYTVERPLDPTDFADAVTPIVGPTGLELAVEPGRSIVGSAGLLLTRCLYRKQAGVKRFAIVDAGMNDLLRPSLYGAVHDIVVVGSPESEHEPATDVVDVVGPVCESGDFFGHDRHLPGALPGALLAVTGAGAYGFTMSSNYNSRPRAAEVLVDGDQWVVIRGRESIEDLVRGERTLEDIERTGAWQE